MDWKNSAPIIQIFIFMFFFSAPVNALAKEEHSYNLGMSIGATSVPGDHTLFTFTGILSRPLLPQIRAGASLSLGSNFGDYYLVDVGGSVYFYPNPDFLLGPTLNMGKVFGPAGYGFPYVFTGMHFGTHLGSSEIYWEPGMLFPLDDKYGSEMQWLRFGASVSF